jgi:hypothetical protein
MAGNDVPWMHTRGIKRDWTRCGLSLESATRIGADMFAQEECGKPTSAFIWSEEIWHDEWSCDETLRVIGILYENGKVLDVRQNKRGNRISIYTAPAQ